MNQQKGNLNLEEQKELVDYAFKKSREQMWWTFTRVVPFVLFIPIVVFGIVYFVVIR